MSDAVDGDGEEPRISQDDLVHVLGRRIAALDAGRVHHQLAVDLRQGLEKGRGHDRWLVDLVLERTEQRPQLGRAGLEGVANLARRPERLLGGLRKQDVEQSSDPAADSGFGQPGLGVVHQNVVDAIRQPVQRVVLDSGGSGGIDWSWK